MKMLENRESHRPRLTIPADDVIELEWFYGPGATRFSRSSMGAILEIIDRRAWTSQRCRDCRGGGIFPLDPEPLEEYRSDGSTAIRYNNTCKLCRGTGWEPIRLKRQSASRGGYEECWCRRLPPTGELCTRCGDTGWVATLPAFPSHAEVYDLAEPDDVAMRRAARITRRIMAAELVFPGAESVYRCLYSDDGIFWTLRSQPWAALFQLTAVGSEMLAGTGAEQIRQDTVALLIDKKRRDKVAVATEQAEALIRAASTAWIKSARMRT